MKKYFIETDEQLEKLCSEIIENKITYLFLDCEGESNLHRYGIHLCLIQIFFNDNVFFIDTIKKLDFTKLKNILENNEIHKIMYSAEFDIKLLKHSLGIHLKGLIDLQIGARLLGATKLSLGAQIQDFLDIPTHKSKSKQRANWFKRPLSPELLEYAASDVLYLKELYTKFQISLRKTKKWDELNDLSQKVENVELKPVSHRDVKGFGVLNYKEKQIFKELYKLRDSVAKNMNKPAFFVYENKNLIELAKNIPVNRDQWQKLPKKSIEIVFINRCMDYFLNL